MINLKISQPDIYFTYSFHAHTTPNLSVDSDQEWLHLQQVVTNMGLENRHVSLWQEKDLQSLNLGSVEMAVDLQTGLLTHPPEVIDASFVYPLEIFPGKDILISAASLGVPLDLFVLFSNKGVDQNPDANPDRVIFRKVMEDMAQKGLAMIQRELLYKAAVISHTIEEHPLLEAVDGPQSKSVLAFNYLGEQDPLELLMSKGYELDSPETGRPYVIYNSATHSKEQFEQLSDILAQVK